MLVCISAFVGEPEGVRVEPTWLARFKKTMPYGEAGVFYWIFGEMIFLSFLHVGFLLFMGGLQAGRIARGNERWPTFTEWKPGVSAFDSGTLLNSSAHLHPNEPGVTAHYDSFSFFVFQREPMSYKCHLPLFP